MLQLHSKEILPRLRTDVIYSRQTVEEDLWEISGLPQPKSGPGGGCPTVAQYSGTERQLYNDKANLHFGQTGCQGEQPKDLIVRSKARYERYGILFELYIHGWEQRGQSNNDFSCNQIKIEIPTLAYKGNNLSAVGPVSLYPTPAIGGFKVKLKPYSKTRRLCYFYLNGRVGSLKGWPNWQFTPFAPVRFNYTP
ncbi:MAG: hypothetical protein MH137_01645 [Flavobacteriales bacterium]|nr:hypothetical protein [Flavobacteriales bacterium]